MNDSMKQEFMKEANAIMGPYIKNLLRESHNESIESLIKIFSTYPGKAIDKNIVVDVLNNFKLHGKP